MIRKCQIESHQFKYRLEEVLGLEPTLLVNGFDCDPGFNRQICVDLGGFGLFSQSIMFLRRLSNDRVNDSCSAPSDSAIARDL
jgi:hypothetical protein